MFGYAKAKDYCRGFNNTMTQESYQTDDDNRNHEENYFIRNATTQSFSYQHGLQDENMNNNIHIHYASNFYDQFQGLNDSVNFIKYQNQNDDFRNGFGNFEYDTF